MQNTQEVVIWNSAGFRQQWTEEAHQEYKRILTQEFGQWMVTPDERVFDVSLDELLAKPNLAQNQGRILMIYEVHNFLNIFLLFQKSFLLQNSHNDPALFFPQLNEKWGNKNDPFELKSYLDQQVSAAASNPDRYKLWEPNCQMTPTTEDIIFGRLV